MHRDVPERVANCIFGESGELDCGVQGPLEISGAQFGRLSQTGEEAVAQGLPWPGVTAGHPTAAFCAIGSAWPRMRLRNHVCQKFKCETISAIECGAFAGFAIACVSARSDRNCAGGMWMYVSVSRCARLISSFVA